MNPSEYQKEAARTECVQVKSASRMVRGMTMLSSSIDNTNLLLRNVRINHAVVGLAGEVGELASILQKLVYYGKEFAPGELEQRIKDELGDVLWYAALLCNAAGLDLSDVMASNLMKLKVRYPEKWSESKADDANRDRGKERAALGDIGTWPEEAPPRPVKCRYCGNPAVKNVVWLLDKNRRPARIVVPWCGCDLMTALKRFWPHPYQITEGTDYEVTPLTPDPTDVNAPPPGDRSGS